MLQNQTFLIITFFTLLCVGFWWIDSLSIRRGDDNDDKDDHDRSRQVGDKKDGRDKSVGHKDGRDNNDAHDKSVGNKSQSPQQSDQ